MLDSIFSYLRQSACLYTEVTGRVPSKVIINYGILASMAKEPGFYERPELATAVTIYVPVVTSFNLGLCSVAIEASRNEVFIRLE